VLGHATASMTLDLYGHVIDANLWRGAEFVGGRIGAVDLDKSSQRASAGLREGPFSGASGVEPPEGVEPSTYALRERILACWSVLVAVEGPEFVGPHAFSGAGTGWPFSALMCTHCVPAEINFVRRIEVEIAQQACSAASRTN
jgi:hypothetical protein